MNDTKGDQGKAKYLRDDTSIHQIKNGTGELARA